MTAASRVQLVPEAPVGLKKDLLGFTAYAKTLAKAARDAEQPLTIGVFGDWGTGKSSLMRMVVEELDEQPQVVTVQCNAWQFQHEEQPLFPLVASVIRLFDDHLSKSMALDGMLEDVEAAAQAITAKDTGRREAIVRAAPVDMSDRIDELLHQSHFARAFQLLKEIQVPVGWKFVIVVDDLDRCSPTQAVRLLESIKLVMDHPGFVFVLGVSRDVIEEHLEFTYRKDQGIQAFSGSSYLEKLIQLPFPIPRQRERILDMARELASTIEESDLKPLLPALTAAFGFNPRALIRVVNNLIIDRSIHEHLSNADQTPRVPIGIFAINRALQHRWPVVHRMIEDAPPEVAVAIYEWGDQIPTFDEDEENATPIHRDLPHIAQTMRDAPELLELLQSDAGKTWLYNKDLRRASAQFVREHVRDVHEPSSTASEAEYDVYFSFQHEDEDVAMSLVKFLEEHDLAVFNPIGLRSGGEIGTKEMERALRSSDSFILLLGATSATSSWLNWEIDTIQERVEREKPAPDVLPIAMKGANIAQLLKRFRAFTDFSGIHLRGSAITSEIQTQILRRVTKSKSKKQKR